MCENKGLALSMGGRNVAFYRILRLVLDIQNGFEWLDMQSSFVIYCTQWKELIEILRRSDQTRSSIWAKMNCSMCSKLLDDGALEITHCWLFASSTLLGQANWSLSGWATLIGATWKSQFGDSRDRWKLRSPSFGCEDDRAWTKFLPCGPG